MKITYIFSSALFLTSIAQTLASDAAEVVFVGQGQPLQVDVEQGDWQQADDYIAGSGQQSLLVATQTLQPGPFELSFKLKLVNQESRQRHFSLEKVISF